MFSKDGATFKRFLKRVIWSEDYANLLGFVLSRRSTGKVGDFVTEEYSSFMPFITVSCKILTVAAVHFNASEIMPKLGTCTLSSVIGIESIQQIEEITADMNGSEWFSTLDANKDFYQIELTDEDSMSMTFATPFGIPI